MADISLKEGSNMRDIFDVCQKHGLPSLAQGMIEFPPPEKLRDIAAKKVLETNLHTYRTRMGEKDYKEAISGLVGKVYGETNVAPDNVLAVAGVAGGVTAALLHLRNTNKEANVAIMEPFYTYHSHEVERAFCRFPSVIPAKGDGPFPDWAELERRVKANEVHGVIVTNPLNPSGSVMSEETVDFLLGLADSHALFVIFDECYLDMMFNGKKHVSPLRTGFRDNVVCCRGFSKCLGCQSWRCGYAISTPATLEGMMAMMDPLYICTNWTQHAMGEYFKLHTEDFVQHCSTLNELLQGNWQILRDAFHRRFGWSSIEPDGTMYAMFKHSEETDIKACEIALKAGVGICPGNVFFGDVKHPPACSGWVRIHCGVAREKAQLIADTLAADEKGAGS